MIRILSKLPKLIAFGVFLFWEIVRSTLRIAWDVITPQARRSTGIVGVPLDTRDERAIALVAYFLSVTPGSLSIELSPDRRLLYVHGMFVRDAESMRQAVKQKFERRVLELLR